ncbi:hypothetical protein [uncultured Nocardioides sp.]|jgi:hypothetical protein|uniref:hypothetical protein n=1 Tax=uncultured Nocardioides sp. TaxID=198441 RepID=UPI002610F6A8|nr:hypothetical protein [uncultured Nocardioides sp.]HRD59369.1 hypothetical protein [Nocardioides sp.]
MSDPTHVERLTEDRDRLERAMDEAEPRELAALVREHRAVLKEIAHLAVPAKGTIRDQLAAKRAARESDAAGSAAAKA